MLLDEITEESSDFLPIIGDEKELLNNDINIPDTLPILPLRNTVLFPGVIIPVNIGRDKSLKLIKYAYKENALIGVIAQKDTNTENPEFDDLFKIGTVASILKILEMPDGTTTAIVQGKRRFLLEDILYDDPYHVGKIILKQEERMPENDPEYNAIAESLKDMASKIVKYSSHIPSEAGFALKNIESMLFLINFISSNTDVEYRSKQELLEIDSLKQRAIKLLEILSKQVSLLELKNDIQKKVKSDIDKQQREYFLHQQMKTIQDELGGNPADEEIKELEEKASQKEWSDSVRAVFDKELSKLKRLNPAAPDYSVQSNYLRELIDLPWNHCSKDNLDLNHAKKILDGDHYGLEKVKERILETIAVREMAPQMPPQILCLVGPPGVGKTSISYSIARSLNRKMARISLGGIHDEADIRGHRKTYVGAMPGRIMTAMTQAGSCNPVLLLDEIDKLGSDYRGDPSAALLEVLDAEQNHDYRDHYLEIPFDLSDVLFITTANTLDTVPRPLLDRMEIIELGSYTDEEKFMIAKNHLIPKQLKKHGLKKAQLRITDDAIRETISCYTRESGVRNLERCFGEICRKTDMEILSQETPKKITVTGGNLENYLGVRKFLPDRLPCTDQVGLVTGLAWTSVGGETLEVEVNVMDGSGKLELTGNLGDVMKESAHAALSYIRANAQKLGVAPDFYKTKDIHVHFPEGAVPKDGPSAGVTVCTAIVSALTGVSVRRDIAMTGEISLRGRVMRIGGLREKTMAALRHGVRTVIIPKDNERDLEEIDQTVRRQLNFISAQTMDTVLSAALNRPAEASPTILTELPGDVRTRVRKPGLRQ